MGRGEGAFHSMWSIEQDETGRCLDVGCGKDKRPGCVGMDRVALPGVDVVHDLETFPWPFADNAFERVYARHVLEHLHAFIPAMEEIHRILVPSGQLHVWVPYYRSEEAFRDPTHVRFFTERTFDYFAPDGQGRWSKFNYYTRARFKVVDWEYLYGGPFSWHVEHYLKSPRLKRLAYRTLFHPKDALRFTLVAIK